MAINKLSVRFMLILFASSFVLPSQAGLFDKLKDKAVDKIKNQSERNIEQEMDRRIEELIPSFEVPESAAPNLDYDAKPEPGVVAIYTTQSCGYCKQAIAWLKDNDVDYREYDVSNHPKGKIDYKMLGGRGVPIILVGDERMNGFSASGVQNMIAKAEYKEEQARLAQQAADAEATAASE